MTDFVLYYIPYDALIILSVDFNTNDDNMILYCGSDDMIKKLGPITMDVFASNFELVGLM